LTNVQKGTEWWSWLVCCAAAAVDLTEIVWRPTAGIDGCLVAKHWKKYGCWDKGFNIDYIIVHVFSIAFYKTGNHNRHNVLGKILYNVSGSCFDTKQQIILPVLAIYIRYFSCSAIVLYTNISQYHYSFLAKKHWVCCASMFCREPL